MDDLKIATHFMVSDGISEQHALYLDPRQYRGQQIPLNS